MPSRAFCSFRRRVLTRLAWMGITQAEFADAIRMDRSLLSRVLRTDVPQDLTIARIATGLGLEPRDLDPRVRPFKPSRLLIDHEAFSMYPLENRSAGFRAWFQGLGRRLRSSRLSKAKRALQEKGAIA